MYLTLPEEPGAVGLHGGQPLPQHTGELVPPASTHRDGEVPHESPGPRSRASDTRLRRARCRSPKKPRE